VKFIYKRSFVKKFLKYTLAEQKLIVKADKEIRNFYITKKAPFGLRIKKLYESKNAKTYEARVSNKIRIIWVESSDLVSFVIIGTHDEIRRYIRSFR
jgi:mRNA-degrading endonuclease YafQ of YafQ-DinJ toxin-antitoxin module